MNTAINSINEKTHNNDHTGALLDLARLLGMRGQANRIEEIQMHQELIGWMTPLLIEARNAAQKEVFAAAKKSMINGQSVYSLLA
jgi:TorA maturation chaperone TorD